MGNTSAPAGLYHYGQRYYDPTTGRWTQQDPLNQPGDQNSANRYAYAGGDPIDATDESGTCVGPLVFLAPLCEAAAERAGAVVAERVLPVVYRRLTGPLIKQAVKGAGSSPPEVGTAMKVAEPIVKIACRR